MRELQQDSFVRMSDTPASFSLADSLFKINGAVDALEETTTVLTEPAANQFQIARGTSALLIQGDLTIESASIVNQDLTTDASPTFAAINAQSMIATNDLTLNFDGDTLVFSEAATLFTITGSQGAFTLTNDNSAKTSLSIKANGAQDAFLQIVYGNDDLAFMRWTQSTVSTRFSYGASITAVYFNVDGSDVDHIFRGDTDNNLLVTNAGDDTVQVGAAATADSAKFFVDGKISTSGEMEINGDLNHDGSNIGFYGTAPISKPTVSVADAASILTALAALGLVTDAT